jgi:flagellar biosynthesis protein FliQ
VTENEVIEVCKDALILMVKISAPVMIAGMGVGLIVSLFQALTQIQENTLTFVPKILAIIVALLISMPFMFDTLRSFTEGLMQKVIAGG